jgi:trimeric autotransporter adhesin
MASFDRIAPSPSALVPSGPIAAPGITYTGTAGGDAQVGTGNDDVFNFGQGGDDTIFGGAGDDKIDLGASFTTADRINGGLGYDVLLLKGDYYSSNQPILGPSTMFAIEEIRFGAGNDYVLTFNDANLEPDQVLTIDARKVGAGDFTSIHTAAETDGAFVFLGGAGNDALYMGQANDTISGGDGGDFVYVNPAYTGETQFDGGAGDDFISTVYSADTTLTLPAKALVHVEWLITNAMPNVGDITIHLTLNDANVAAGETMLVSSGGTVGATTAVFYDGSAERDGHYEFGDNNQDDTMIGGRLADTFKLYGGGSDWAQGGQGDDVFQVTNGTLDSTDRLDGGAGDDVLQLSGDYFMGLSLRATTLRSVESIVLDGNYSYELAFDDGVAAKGTTLAVNGSALTVDQYLLFDGSDETDAAFRVDGGAAEDILSGGKLGDILLGRAGEDLLIGNRGADRLSGGNGADSFRYKALVDTLAAAPDLITDFGSGADTIDLQAIDANTKAAGDQAFHLGATAKHAGDIVVKYIAASGYTEVRLYVDKDNTADAVIRLTGDHHDLSAGDFLL